MLDDLVGHLFLNVVAALDGFVIDDVCCVASPYVKKFLSALKRKIHLHFDPLYSITLSADVSRVDGTVSPSALAALRLMTSSKLVGCWIGRSAGFVPLRTFPT